MSVTERPAPAAGAPSDEDRSGRGAAFSSPEGGEQLQVVEPLIFAASRPGRRDVRFPIASDAARAAAASQPAIPADAQPKNLERYLYQFRLGPHPKVINRMLQAIEPDKVSRWAGAKTDRAVGY